VLTQELARGGIAEAVGQSSRAFDVRDEDGGKA
jgi:hypothetical protein